MIFGLFAMVAGYWFLLRPGVEQAKSDAVTALETAQAEETSLQSSLARLQQIAQHALEYQIAVNELEYSIPAQPQLAEFIIAANELSETNGLDWLSITPNVPTQAMTGPYAEIQAQMQLEGSFFEVLNYLIGVRDLDRLVRIDNLALTATPDAVTGEMTLSASVTAVLFTTSTLTEAQAEALAAGTSTAGTPTDGATTTETTTPATPTDSTVPAAGAAPVTETTLPVATETTLAGG